MESKKTIDFHLTTTKELLAIKDRIRNLVDHWGEDGRYKEAILKTIISRFLPQSYSIATGFVVRQTKDRKNHESSKQIDLIIYDNRYPTFFKESDFIIVTPDSVRGIIEVKANLKNQKSGEIIKKANATGKFIFEGKKEIDNFLQEKDIVQGFKSEGINRMKFFNGIFSYAGFEKTENEKLKEYIIDESNLFIDDPGFSLFCVNHISFNKNIFYKYWDKHWDTSGENFEGNIYELEDLSFSFFISNLIDYLSESTFSNTHLWFPDDKNKSDKQIGFNFI